MSIAHIYFWPKSVKFCTFCNSRLSNQPLHLTEIGQISSLKNWSLQYICDRLLTFDRTRLNFFHLGLTLVLLFILWPISGKFQVCQIMKKVPLCQNFLLFGWFLLQKPAQIAIFSLYFHAFYTFKFTFWHITHQLGTFLIPFF